MATYAIGDIQGCFNSFEALLDTIHFDAQQDNLWFTGDLVNRGLQSLEVLRKVKAMGEQHKIVLGNHDLHLLAVAAGVRTPNATDTFQDILQADDRDALLGWLRHRPLLHYDEKLQFVMTHAGIAPAWDLLEARHLAKELETALRGDAYLSTLQALFGDSPNRWSEDLQGDARLRCIVNYLTRMRFCHSDGSLDFTYKGTLEKKPPTLIPWFLLPRRKPVAAAVIFGHWAALAGEVHIKNYYALDTGCVWGNSLTALRLEDRQRFSVKCQKC